jgi:hypothetical protein
VRRPTKPWWVLAALGSAAAFAACSTNDPAASCPPVDASTCRLPIPSYANDVAPILDRRCNSTCHAPGVGPWPLNNYPDVHDWVGIIGPYVAECEMPPDDAAAGNGDMTYQERVTVLDWLVCGAPNN